MSIIPLGLRLLFKGPRGRINEIDYELRKLTYEIQRRRFLLRSAKDSEYKTLNSQIRSLERKVRHLERVKGGHIKKIGPETRQKAKVIEMRQKEKKEKLRKAA